MTMSVKAARRILWLTFLLTIPVPYWGIEVGRAPAARLLLLASVTGTAAVAEGGRTLTLVGGLFVLQALLACAVLYLLARVVARVVYAIAPASVRGLFVGAIVGVLLGTSLLDVYHTPFARSGPRTNLFGIFG